MEEQAWGDLWTTPGSGSLHFSWNIGSSSSCGYVMKGSLVVVVYLAHR